jgi:UDP-N-acetylmuramyl pentapeptide phosphotransferase/UDP-N-acetylglucosamine-1-phosphate transferase
MNILHVIGVFLVALGLAALLIPIPRREDHSVKIGDTKISVQTQRSEKLPPGVGIVLVAGGVVALVLASRKR